MRRAAIIGDASLAGHCIELAQEHGLDVVVVATEHSQVRDRAASLGIPVVHSTGDVGAALDPFDFDVLFSIANLRVLPQRLLDRAAVAINFHDGPLPGYAGLNVTTWALLAGEQEHAVTWHLMKAVVDGGDVVAPERFPIRPDDTAFSLNARCYEAAIATFPGIVDALVAATLTTTPQPTGERRLFRRFERPTAIVDPTDNADDIERVVRSMSLGHAASNSLGAVHLVAAGGHVIITGVRSLGSNGAAVGTLTVDPAGLRLAVTGGDLLIDGIETVTGRAITPTEALGELGLASGDRIAVPAADLVEAFRVADPTLARHESHWRSLLQGATPVAPPLLAQVAGPARQVSRPIPSDATTDDVVAAVVAWAWRLGGVGDATIGLTDAVARRSLGELAPLLHIPVMRFAVDETTTFHDLVGAATERRTAALDHGPFLTDLIGREPALVGTDVTPRVTIDLDDPVDRDETSHPSPGELWIGIAGSELRFTSTLAADVLERIADQLSVLLTAGSATPGALVADLPVLGPSEHALLDAINRTEMAFDRDATVDQLVVAQAARTPDAPAVTSDGVTLTYRELLDQVAAMASRLAERGVRPRDRVGIALERGTEMLVAVLATHACGAAYVPLDPTYPAERLRLMVTDSGLRTVVAEPDSTVLDDALDGVVVVHPADAGSSTPTMLPVTDHGASDLAYVIYTSGSTGTPKGVMLEHRNVVNFFAAMDAVIEHDPPGVWLAVTSLSFDISVLELLWTLTRGFHVVIKPDGGTKAMQRLRRSPRPLTMSLFYFAAGEDTAHDGYRLLLDSARWADTHGFEAVWTPERHFHAFGGAYPNPAVVGAAVAAVTKNVRIRAGSVVAPLHSPARIAEEWAVVDNLSGGRVDLSFAAGWQPNDFVLNPGAYATARDQLPTMIDTVRRLWRGDTVDMPGHDGAPVAVRTLPRPVQPELPVWLTSAGSTSTFERAGTLGTNLLTHLLGQSLEQLAENISSYRAAWKSAGHPGQGQVTLMLHTYLHPDSTEARRIAHDPMKSYLGSAAGLLKNMASAFPTFAGSGKSADEAFASLTADEMDQLLEMAAGRYLETSGLFGTVDDAVDMIERCSRAGVDEVACLIDFGVDTDAVLDSLPLLEAAYGRVADARRHATGAERVDEAGDSVADLVARHRVTHLQCTPSLATMLVADPADRAALGTIGHVMLGGEPLPTALAAELMRLLSGRLTNMYGPTETTIWSLVHELTEPPTGSIPIGRPIGNNTVHVLDQRGIPSPIGAFGELHIGGDSVARGYHDRPELTAERIVDRPELGRVYATGDIVRIRADGVVEFAGRSDGQVKIRGHRIELGEIETIIDTHPDVVQSVVVAHRSDVGDPTLIAFVVSRDARDLDEPSVRSLIGERLPDAYLPARIISLDGFPLTPNGKTDRGRLEADVGKYLGAALRSDVVAEVFDDATEQLVAEVWTAELRRPVGRDDNFFDIGGNSLLAVAVFRRIGDRTDVTLALTDVFRYPTIRTFASHLARAGSPGQNGAPAGGERSAGDDAPTGVDRGAMRRRALARRSS